MAKGKSNRKHGRNKASCKRYRDEGRQEKAKARRIKKHEKRYPKRSRYSAAQRRIMGANWKREQARRIEEVRAAGRKPEMTERFASEVRYIMDNVTPTRIDVFPVEGR